MRILEKIQVPTGYILVVEGSRGKLEMLTIGDYGKEVNLKADHMGLEREPEKVRHTKLLPLEEKWVITISTQYGCSMNCTYCDVPSVGPGRNATFNDLIQQVITGINVYPEVKFTKRLNIHFARMGEPSWNPNVLDATQWLWEHVNPERKVHPVVTTMCPKRNEWLKTFIHGFMRLKNRRYEGNAGLQLSINSTNEREREIMFHGNAHPLHAIGKIMDGIVPYGRKITLNFPVCDWEIDPDELLKYFDPDFYIVKLTPMHKTTKALKNGIMTKGDYTEYYPYKDAEERLKKAGYEVLVFIASVEEDLGMITCGNAVLSGKIPEYQISREVVA